MKGRGRSLTKLSSGLTTNSSLTFPKIEHKRIIQSKFGLMKQKLVNNQQLIKQQKIKKQSRNIVIPNLANLKVKRSQSSIVKPDQKQIDINAQAFGVYDQNLNQVHEYNANEKREIASLTKMMTMLVVLKLSQKFNVQIKNTYFRVSVNASNINGTIAELDPKQWVTVQDLLYAMMLPSGNDAAMVLAQNFGAFLFYQKQGQQKALFQVKSLDITNDTFNLKLYFEDFIKCMNITAKQMQMNSTFFMNPHGLDCKQAYSTIKDLSILLNKIMKNDIALKIIGTKNYFARLKITIGKKQISYRQVDWINTHRLLWKQGYVGGKTGQTTGAGSCLATIFEHQGKRYYVILLSCQNREDRFTETQKLIKRFILKTY